MLLEQKMKIKCEHCGEESLMDVRRGTHKKTQTRRMERCPHCGRKVFVPIIQRYTDDEAFQI
jgi:DNA-directed RNA polymerase subunit RPC12/RpoP